MQQKNVTITITIVIITIEATFVATIWHRSNQNMPKKLTRNSYKKLAQEQLKEEID